MKNVIKELKELWANKTKHGAHRQKFGTHQENLLEDLVKKIVPVELRPDKNASLKLDTKFKTYAKAICWNQQKSMGRKISRERSIRSGMASLSEFDHLSYLGERI